LAGVKFSDSDSAPISKFVNPDPGRKIFQIWESESCSDSSKYRCNRNYAMSSYNKWQL